MPTAVERSFGSSNIAKISDSVDGAIVAPATPRSARLAISIVGRCGERGEDRGAAECRGADEQHPPPPDPVAERAHRDEEAGDHEAVDVEDPEQLHAARPEVAADGGHGQVEDREVHDVEQAREREDGKAEPLAAPARVARPGRAGT